MLLVLLNCLTESTFPSPSKSQNSTLIKPVWVWGKHNSIFVGPFSNTGVYNLPIDLLREPPDYLRVREVKEWFVEYLMGMLEEEETDHEDLTAPLLVIVSCTKDEFRPKHLQKYTYEVSTTLHVKVLNYHYERR